MWQVNNSVEFQDILEREFFLALARACDNWTFFMLGSF